MDKKKKHYKENPHYVKKRGVTDENLVTPPTKSRRCTSSSGKAALKDKGNTCCSKNIVDDMNIVLVEMTSELGSIATAIWLLTKALDYCR